MPSRLCRSLIPFLATAALAACGGDDVPFIDASGQVIDAPGTDAATDAAGIDAPVDAAAIDGAEIDAPMIDAPIIDAAMIDAPVIDAPIIDAAQIDAAQIDAAQIDAAQIDAAPPIDAPPPIDAAIDAAIPQAGDTCQLAELITIPGGIGTITVAATTAGYANEYEPTCTGFDTLGPDRVHTVSIPAGARLTANVQPAAGYDAGIYLVGNPAALCDASPIACLAADDSGGSGTLDGVTLDNTGTGPLEVFIVIDGLSPTGGAYDLDVTTGPIPGGDVCSDAEVITLTSGAATVAGTTSGMTGDYFLGTPAVSCTEWWTDGPDQVHTVSVPSLATLDVIMTPASGYDAAVYLVAGPALACDADPIVCLDGADVDFAGDPEVVSYTNAGGSALEVFIVVDGDLELSSGDTYTLDVTVTPP